MPLALIVTGSPELFTSPAKSLQTGTMSSQPQVSRVHLFPCSNYPGLLSTHQIPWACPSGRLSVLAVIVLRNICMTTCVRGLDDTGRKGVSEQASQSHARKQREDWWDLTFLFESMFPMTWGPPIKPPISQWPTPPSNNTSVGIKHLSYRPMGDTHLVFN